MECGLFIRQVVMAGRIKMALNTAQGWINSFWIMFMFWSYLTLKGTQNITFNNGCYSIIMTILFESMSSVFEHIQMEGFHSFFFCWLTFSVVTTFFCNFAFCSCTCRPMWHSKKSGILTSRKCKDAKWGMSNEQHWGFCIWHCRPAFKTSMKKSLHAWILCI